MITLSELKCLQAIGFDMGDRERLVDIKKIELDNSLDKARRTLQYANAVQNPYLFRVDDTVVQVKYGKESKSLQNSFTKYLLQQQAISNHY